MEKEVINSTEETSGSTLEKDLEQPYPEPSPKDVTSFVISRDDLTKFINQMGNTLNYFQADPLIKFLTQAVKPI